MPFVFRNDIQRPLEWSEVDGNFQEVENLYAQTLEARDISIADSIIYPDTTAGLAATAEGGYFVVPDSGTDELVFYREEAGVAVEKVRIGYRLPFVGGTLTAALNHAPVVGMASAATVDIGAASSNVITITGTTTITSLGTIASGAIRVLVFADALTLTHNATSLILPGAANITTAAGDVAVMLSLGSGNWRCIAYQRASGKSTVARTTTINVPHTWAVSGEIKVPSGGNDTIPGMIVPTAAAGQTMRLVGARYRLASGTSATVTLQRNGVDITGFTGISVTPTQGSVTPTAVTLAAGDYIQPVVTAVSGTPKDLTLSIAIEYAAAGV